LRKVSDLFQSKTIPPIRSTTPATTKPIGFALSAPFNAHCPVVKPVITVLATPEINAHALVTAVVTFTVALYAARATVTVSITPARIDNQEEFFLTQSTVCVIKSRKPFR